MIMMKMTAKVTPKLLLSASQLQVRVTAAAAAAATRAQPAATRQAAIKRCQVNQR
jgi:hypothetical protein